jgi:tripartite-type tricarboxylate transporter receptor subunit TctC
MVQTRICGALSACVAAFCLTFVGDAVAQSFPTRAVTIVAPTTPGSLPDVIARGIGQRLSTKWQHPVVVENKAGGAYSIAAAAVSNAPADGYTILVTESGFYTTQPHLTKRSAYVQSDFMPVSGVASIPTAMVAHPAVAATSIKDLVALAKAKPGSLNYGTPGPGTAPHLGMLLFEQMAQVKLAPVHYRGVSPVVNDLIAGHIQLALIGPTIALPAYKAGKVKILGVGAKNSIPQLAGIPLIADSVPGFEMSVSFSVFVRAGTPQDIVTKINADVQEIVRDPAFAKQFLEPQALQAMLGTQQDIASLMKAESDKWLKVIRETNLVIE